MLGRDTMPTRDAFNGIVDRAEAGDAVALRDLRGILRSFPGVFEEVGDLVRHVETELTRHITRDSMVFAEALKVRVTDMRDELGYATAHPLQRLLIDRVVSSWLDLQHVQVAKAEPRTSKTDTRFWDERLDRAQRRHLAAIEQLDKSRLMEGSG